MAEMTDSAARMPDDTRALLEALETDQDASLALEGVMGWLREMEGAGEEGRMARDRHLRDTTRALATLADQRGLPDSALQQIVDWVAADFPGEKGRRSGPADRGRRLWYDLLANREDLSQASLLRLVRAGLERGTSDLVTEALLSPAAGPDLWGAALEAAEELDRVLPADALDELSTREAFRTDPELRALARPQAPPEALERLIDHAEGEEFRALFRRLAEVGPATAARVLKRHRSAAISILAPEDLMDLLQHWERPVRERALEVLTELED